jgi:hypothetical protein
MGAEQMSALTFEDRLVVVSHPNGILVAHCDSLKTAKFYAQGVETGSRLATSGEDVLVALIMPEHAAALPGPDQVTPGQYRYTIEVFDAIERFVTERLAIS